MRGMQSLFGRITTRAEALKVIKDSAIGFFVLAGIQGAVAFFLMPLALVDAAAYAILGAGLLIWKSRIAAVLLTILSGVNLVATALNVLQITSLGGNNIALAVIVFIVAIRSVNATFQLHGRFTKEDEL